jgi:hypothetical protein
MSVTDQLKRAETLTTDDWSRLPWLLPKAVVVEWTGLSRRAIDQLIQEGRLRVLVARRKRRFYKADVAVLIGIAGPDCAQIGPNGHASAAGALHARQVGAHSTL